MISWLSVDKGAIFRDKSRNGLLSNFLKDYKNEFGGSINPGCRKCLNDYYNKFIKKYTMKNDTPLKCDYELHKKYNGIQLGVNGRPIRNGEMTNEIAKELLEKHPRGVLLFSKYPVEEVKEETIKPKRKAKRLKK